MNTCDQDKEYQAAGKVLVQLGDEIVISGIAGRFPSSKNVEELHRNLFDKVEMAARRTRWYPQRSSQSYCGTIDSIEKFDAGFFGIHHSQAEHMDPEVRLLMEHAFEAIVDAGCCPQKVRGSRVGVFIANNVMESNQKLLFNSDSCFGVTGCVFYSLAQWISYSFNFTGPSITADTACSSGLYVLDMAYKAIKMDQCDSAIVGGSHLCMHPEILKRLSPILSPEGICRSFDADSNGFVRAESVAVLYLQKQKDAKRIYAKILHIKSLSGTDSDMSYGCPSLDKQVELMTEVRAECELDPKDLGLLEAHGTGTVTGDPLEVSAVDQAYCQKRSAPLYIGSCKSNLGHSEAVAGMISVIKVLGCFEKEAIAPNLYYNKPRPGMDALEKGRLMVPTDVVPWPKNVELIAAVNSLGYGGANTHGLFKSVTKSKKNDGVPLDDLPRLICVSGRTKEAVEYLFNRIANEKLNEEFVRLLHEVYSDNITGHPYRGYIIVSKKGELRRSLTNASSTNQLRVLLGGPNNKITTCAKYLATVPTFNAILDSIDSILKSKHTTLKKVLRDQEQCPEIFFPVFGTLIQIALVKFLKVLGLVAEYQVRSDAGALAYAYADDAFTLEEVVLKALDSHDPSNGYRNCITLVADDFCMELTDCACLTSFLAVLGSVYELGHVFKFHLLYPEVQWPVSKRTPMISPLIKWNHDDDWFVVDYKTTLGIVNGERVIHVKTSGWEYSYIKGHVIDDRNLVPATTYLHMVWETVALYLKQEITKTPIKLENVQILQGTSVSPNNQITFRVTLHNFTGRFEIEESGRTVITGRYLTKGLENFDDYLDTVSEPDMLISNRDMYKEFKLKGYVYSDPFRCLQEAYINGSKGYLKWQNNWPVFMDNMMHILFLCTHSRFLYVPTSIGSVTIDPEAHLQYMKKVGEDCVPIFFCKTSKMLRSGFIEIRDISVLPMTRRRLTKVPVLETCQFIPFQSKLRFDNAIQVCVQIVCENYGGKGKISLVELVHTPIADTDLMMPIIVEIFNNTVYYKYQARLFSTNTVEIPNVTVVSNNEIHEINTTSLMVTSHALQKRTVMQQILDAIQDNAMLLTKEYADVDVEELSAQYNLSVVSIYQTELGQLALLRKLGSFVQGKLVDVSANEDLRWLLELQEALKDNTGDIVVYSQNQKLSGLPGFYNCLKLEQGVRVKSFTMLEEAPSFDPEAVFYRAQAQKHLSVNVFKNGQWGSYRHLKLDESKPLQTKHVSDEEETDGEVVGNDIAIDVYYSTLNFKDIMIASGRIVGNEGYEHLICFEFSGKDKSGKRYMGYSLKSSLASTVLCPRDSLLEVPESWSLAEAATVSIVYVTAIFSVIQIGGLQRGQTILIHCGAGGVGQAAINIALHYDCNIFTTVGTEEKKAFILKEFPQIPASHVGNSRDLSFEQMVMKHTKGRGVDLVLNSLAGDKLLASMRCLAPKGKFLEIGKYDAMQNRQLNCSFVNGNRSSYGIMLDSIHDENEWLMVNVLKTFRQLIRSNVVKPLNRTIFSREEVPDAFRYMSKGEHIGKVMVEIRKEQEDIFTAIPRFCCKQHLSYIIVGGLGGFGLELTNWLIARGAKNIVVVSRSGVKTGYQERYKRHWKKLGARVVVSTSDISTKAGCLDIIEQATELGQIDGIFNLAVVLKDGLVESLKEEDVATVLIPKSIATRHFDEITRELCPNLRYFVVFSSVSCGKGNAGQTNYGMANSIMERICEQRKLDGYPGLAIQWGIIGDVGLVADMLEEKKIAPIGDLKEQGIDSCLDVLDAFLTQQNPIVLSMVVEKNTSQFKSESTIEMIITQVLGISNTKSVSYNSTLNELGMDSISTTMIKQLLEKDFDTYMSMPEIRELTLTKLDEIFKEKKNQPEKLTEIVAQVDMLLNKV